MRKLRYLKKKLPLCSPQIPFGLAWNQTLAYTMGITDNIDQWKIVKSHV
jgi:hypothetical protein